MITQDNIKEVLQSIDKEQIEAFYSDQTTDTYVLWVDVFNAGYTVSLEPFYVSYDSQKEIEDNGGLLLYFDELSQLFSEQGMDVFELMDETT